MISKKSQIALSQKNFIAHLVDEKKSTILAELPYSRAEALERLNIYRNNVFGNFDNLLSENFKITKNLMGEKEFQEILEKYYQKFSSKSGNLTDYVVNFPKIFKSSKAAYLKDLSQFELLLHQSYFAENVANFDTEKLQKIAPEKYQNLILELHPSCFLMTTDFTIFSCYKNYPKKSKIAKKIEFILIFKSLAIKLSQEEFVFLSAVKKQQKLYNIFKKITRISDKKIDIGKMLNKFILKGVIVNFKIAK